MVFETENEFSPLAHREVSVKLAPPARLISPPGGTATTRSDGSVDIVYAPVAVYDESAFRDGDIIADYPAVFSITLKEGGELYQWEVDDTLSYAHYQDPLYQGLDREPDQGPVHINLTIR
jgi:hypothetical protein